MRKIPHYWEEIWLNEADLTEEQLEDIHHATKAREEAGARCSGFTVGAAIRTNDEKVYLGWNLEGRVENAEHAECNAAGRITNESRKAGIKRITIVGAPKGEESEIPVMICGICRQRLIDMLNEDDNPEVIMCGTKGEVIKALLRDILPLAFEI